MRKISSLFFLWVFVGGLFAVLPKSATAQDDPPGRVARLNYMQGSISYQISGDQDWVQADPNRPLTTGDNLWADKDSRGEVHIGSTAIRLSSETGLSFLTLDDRTVQLQLAQGTIEVHLRNMGSGEAFEIDTPNLALTLDRGGEYRISTDPDGNSTVIIVREGEGEVTGGGDSWNLGAGQQYTFNGTDQLSYDAVGAPDFDDFEGWCQTRDQRENSAVSAKYVSRDIDGYYDLDEYGDWSTDPDYGAVWIPRGVAADWAPYQVGHWVYVAPWGWTWVDEEPWGFAPFHYGRWAYVGARWGWVPGPLVVRPVYAPALVAFVGGGGGGFGISVGFGGGFAGVAWFPLGPRDVFIPGYRASARYVQNVNITNTRVVNVTQVTNVYNTVVINRDVTHVNYTYARNDRAVTAVTRDTFVGARPVNRETVRVTADQIDHARVVDSSPIAPTRASYVSATAKVSNSRPAVPFSQRPVVARLNPAVQVNRRAAASGNDNRGPGQQGFEQFGGRGNNNEPAAGASTRGDANSSNSGAQAPRDGFRSFQPPQNRGGNNGTAAAANPNTGTGTVNNNGQPSNRTDNPGVNPNATADTRANPNANTVNNDANNRVNNGAQTRDRSANTNPPTNVNPNANANTNAVDNNGRPNNNLQPFGRNNGPNQTTGPKPTTDVQQPSNQTQNQNQNQDRSGVRFTPPQKARDDMYDVHPALNNREAQAPPKQEQRAPPPAKKNDKKDNKKDDKK